MTSCSELEVISHGSQYERQTSASGEVRHVPHGSGVTYAERAFDEATGLVETHFLHRDERNTVIFTTDENGEPSELREFDAFGAATATGPNASSLGFTGGRSSDELALVMMGSRLYDPLTGSFTTTDLLAVNSDTATGVNPYAYANNDPVNFQDPTGLSPEMTSETPYQTITVFGAPLPPLEPYYSSWGAVRSEVYSLQLPTFRPFEQVLDHYTFDGHQITCNGFGACAGGDLSNVLISLPGDEYSERGQALQLSAANFLLGVTPIPSLAIVMDSNASTLGRFVAGVYVGVSVGAVALKVAGAAVSLARTATAARGAEGGIVVHRWMSRAELAATEGSGMLRGGREGVHYVTDSANSSALRAQQRLALPQTPEVRVTMRVPEGVFSTPSRVEPAFNMPGGGMERTASGPIPIQILRIDW